MKLREVRLYGTTDTSGDLTVTGDAVFGKVYAVAWIDGTLDDNNTAVLSTINHDAASTILTLEAGEGDDDAIFYPRAIVHDAGAESLTGTAGGDRAEPLAAGNLQLVIAAGGALKSGGCIVFIEEC